MSRQERDPRDLTGEATTTASIGEEILETLARLLGVAEPAPKPKRVLVPIEPEGYWRRYF